MEHVYNGRTWRLIGKEPYTRRDGGQTEVIVWRSACRECGAPFEIRTPAAFGTSKAFGTVHCPEHRSAASQARTRDTAAQRQSTGNASPWDRTANPEPLAAGAGSASPATKPARGVARQSQKAYARNSVPRE